MYDLVPCCCWEWNIKYFHRIKKKIGKFTPLKRKNEEQEHVTTKTESLITNEAISRILQEATHVYIYGK